MRTFNKFAELAKRNPEIMEKIQVTKMEVTPSQAAAWLERVPDEQRSLTDHVVARYMRDMAEEAMAFNVDPIVISEDGSLINGQHRLHACVRSGESFYAVVIRNAPRELIMAIDVGKSRTATDFLSMQDVSHARCVSAMCAQVWKWENGVLGVGGSQNLPDARERVDVFDRYPDMETMASKHHNAVKSTVGRSGTALGLVFLFGLTGGFDEADRFVEDLTTGANLSIGDPVLLVRNKLLARLSSPSTEMVKREFEALLIKAWLYRREGRKMKMMVWRSNESFPELPGPEDVTTDPEDRDWYEEGP